MTTLHTIIFLAIVIHEEIIVSVVVILDFSLNSKKISYIEFMITAICRTYELMNSTAIGCKIQRLFLLLNNSVYIYASMHLNIYILYVIRNLGKKLLERDILVCGVKTE